MNIRLLRYTPLNIADLGIGVCHDNGPSKDEEHMVKRIDRVCNKMKHESILEHISYTFQVEGVSRALLQELARHRMASLSVQSSRYTLHKDLINAKTEADIESLFVH